jgi:alpha-tubulin suppressor-like RCC1 family protein
LRPQENSGVTSRYGDTPNRIPPTLLTVTRGTEHGCGLSADGRAFCWGSNRLGQLGDGDDSPNAKTGAVAVATAQTFVVISAGANHTCALTRQGVAYCWGLNFTGRNDGPVRHRLWGIRPHLCVARGTRLLLGEERSRPAGQCARR